MITIKNILLQITSKLIELYPSRFQQEFSEEIYSTFHELLNEYVDRGIISLLMKWFSEIYILFFSILREHQYELNKGDLNMQPIRWTWQNICAVVSPVFLWFGILRLNE